MAGPVETDFPIDGQTWRRLKREVKTYLTSSAGSAAKWRLATLIGLLLTISALNVLNSYVGRDFVTAIENRNMSGFVGQAVLYIGVFALSTGAATIFRYVEERSGLEWRQWLTGQWVDGYLDRRAYYHLQAHGSVDNPDQRIAEDMRTFTTTTLSFTLMILNSSITVLAFAGVLWAISPLLLVVTVLYAVGGSLVTFWVGRRLIGLNYVQLDREAEFRLNLMHVREHAESVALLHREPGLRNRLLHSLERLVDNFANIVRVNRNLNYFSNGYNYLSQIVPALVVAPLFIRGEVEFGVITQSAMAFAHLIGAFSLIVTNFQSLSTFAAVVARVGGLRESVDEALCAASGACTQGNQPLELVDDGLLISYTNVTLTTTHNRQVLVNDLNVTIHQGMRVLITGPNEEAKSALFRATAGVWDKGSGRIIRPSSEDIYFLPEHPYLPPGSLRQMLVRSHTGQEPNDAQILSILDGVGLGDLCERIGGLDRERNWDSVLSLGEQQWLAVARLLLAKPAFVFLDRIRTSLRPEDMMEVLRLLNAHGIAYITIGRARHGKRDNDDKLEDYDAELQLLEQGQWQWHPN